MPDFSSLTSQLTIFKNATSSLMTSSALTSNDLALIAAALNAVGNDLGVADISSATASQIVNLNASATSAIANINASANGSLLTTHTSQITNHTNRLVNLEGFVSTNSTQYSTLQSSVNSLTSSVGGSTPSVWKLITTSYIATMLERLMVVPANGMIITLPLSPSVGAQVWIMDAASTAGTTNFQISGNGQSIQGSPSNLVFNVSGQSIALVYTGATYGWRKA